MAQFSVHDAKTNLSKLIAEALEGGDVVIARSNGPWRAWCRSHRTANAALGPSRE